MKRLLIAIIISIISLASCTRTEHNVSYERTEHNEELVQLFSVLSENHKSFFNSVKRKDAYDILNSLLLKEEGSEAEEFFDLLRISAIAHDSHTSVYADESVLSAMHIIPVAFKKFGDRLFIIAAGRDYEELIGKAVKEINGYSFSSIIELSRDVIPNDNDVFLSASLYSNYMRILEFYSYIGISDSSDSIEIETEDGLIMEVKAASYSNQIDLVFAQKAIPSTLNPYSIYSAMLLPCEDALLINYHSCSEMDGYPFNEFSDDVLDLIRERGCRKIIIDLRYNGGGNSEIIRPLIDGLKEIKRSDDIAIYVLIGEQTFSSAILNAEMLKDQLGAVLAGNPTGGSASHYGEVITDALPYSGIPFQYSTKYFRNKIKGPIIPDIMIEENIDDYVNGIDSALKALGLI